MDYTNLIVIAALCVAVLLFCGVVALRSWKRERAHRRGEYDRR